MRPELRTVILEWKNNPFYGESRRGKVSKAGEEYIIQIEQSVRVNVAHHTRDIRLSRRLHTHAQSPNSELNPMGDVRQFIMVSNTLNQEFIDLWNSTVDEFLQDITPDGFLDL